MSAKKIIKEFYKSDAMINSAVLEPFLHPDVVVEWNSTTGFVKMKFKELMNFATELSKAYVRSKARISHIIQEGDMVTVRYSHYIKTIENPREEMFLAHFMVIWEIKDGKLYRGYQMSHIS